MKPLLKASDEAEFKRRYQSIMSPYNADNEWRLLQHAGIAEKPLEEGWYWVCAVDDSEWEPGFYHDGSTARPWYIDGSWRTTAPVKIGPRILPPSQEDTDGK